MRRIALENRVESIAQACWAGCDTRPTFMPPDDWPQAFDLPARSTCRFTTRIGPGERGLLFRRGRFVRLLKPGAHRLWERLLGCRGRHIEVVDAGAGPFDHPFLQAILENADARASLVVLELSGPERALVWLDGRLAAVHGPGCHVYWNTGRDIVVERFGAGAGRLVHAKLEEVAAHPHASTWLEAVEVDGASVAGRINANGAAWLSPGRHLYWKGEPGAVHVTRQRRARLTSA